ncbi:unnamed protein product, partial [Mesorhabditis belari]|uniref:Uncharacterized protein n=1 Tax=Mesorhabditis belari TaxID=2138241 RepID=A0AAF3EGZ0_9BILA
MIGWLVFAGVFCLGLFDSTLGCQRLGSPGCSSCEQDLNQFDVDIADFPDKPPGAGLYSPPTVYTYSTNANGCLVASSVCNPNAAPDQPTISVISFDPIAALSDLNGNSFGGEGNGPNPTRKSEFRCQAGQWYSVQKDNPAKKGLVASVLCVSARQ